MTDADTRAAQINAFYAARTPVGASAPSRTDICSSAAQTRWEGRGGPSVTIRISALLAARLYEAIPQPDRRAFVEAAIEDSLAQLGGATRTQ